MSRSTILADLVFRHCSKPEDAATDALVFLLMSDKKVLGVFQDLIESKTGLKLPEIVKLKPRVQLKSGSCPDIVGSTTSGQELLFVENKFWAGLTERQPVQYLIDLKELRGAEDSAILLFICPESAIPMYSDEIHNRISEASETINKVITTQPFQCLIDEKLSIIIVSWQSILDIIKTSATELGETKLVEDISQLIGLVNRIDSDQAFLPLKAEDLGAEHGRRWKEFDRIQWDLINKLINSPYNMGYHQNSTKVDLGGPGKWEVVVCLELGLWAKFGRTPFWIVVSTYQPHFDFIRNSFQPWVHCNPPKAFELTWWNTECMAIPLSPLLGVPRKEVLKDLAKQVSFFRDILLEKAEEATNSNNDDIS